MRFEFSLSIDFRIFISPYLWFWVFTSVLSVIVSISTGVVTVNLREAALELSDLHGRKYLIPFPDTLDEISLMMSTHTANEHAICLDTWFYFYDL